MKKFVLLLFVLAFCLQAVSQVSISVDNSTPDPSAMLDVKSAVKGLLPPRVSLSATNLATPVSSPAIGLQVYNTATAGMAPYNVSPGIYSWDGVQWVPVIAPKGANSGDMQYWNGSQWVLIPAGSYGQQLFFCNGIPVWGGCPPVLTTAAISSITANSAVSGGNITLDGGLPVLARGVCWSTNPNPTIMDSKTTDGTGTGTFVTSITGLLPNTNYYVRSYAANGATTGYGNELNFTTLCEFYPTVGVSIEASTNPVCDGSIVSIQATPTNGGLLPVYQWKVNGFSFGTNNSAYMYTPANHDTVQCIMTSSLPCTSTPAISNTIIITVNPMLSVGVTIAASANNVCAGDTVTFTATGTNTGTISNYQWKLGGNVISGATNATYTYVPANNDVFTCVLASNPPCTFSNTATSNAITMTVNAVPESPSSGTHIPTQTEITWNWNTVPNATGYKWGTTSNYSEATEMSTATTTTETGLTCNTLYTRYAWAYNACGNSAFVTLSQSTSSCSFACGSSFTDSRDNQVYTTVLIGSQCWMRQNLNIGTRINGTVEQTNNSTIEKYCYNNNDSNCNIYGALYQWDEMMQYVTTAGVKGICPTGWHIPTHNEWITCTTFLGGTGVAGGKMKSTGTIEAYNGLWHSPNTGATNVSGFTAIPAGYRYYDGTFYSIGYFDLWWNSNEDNYGNGGTWLMGYNYGYVDRILYYKKDGFSVRCLRD
ncbi:MAG: hypothetical protein NTW16_00925 [Bacteroidetes bacterium]|nr:hypothetical protein [Bacteroidota bacterium]